MNSEESSVLAEKFCKTFGPIRNNVVSGGQGLLLVQNWVMKDHKLYVLFSGSDVLIFKDKIPKPFTTWVALEDFCSKNELKLIKI